MIDEALNLSRFCVFACAPACVCPQMGDCMEFPTHGYEGDQPTFCMTHMATGMKVKMC